MPYTTDSQGYRGLLAKYPKATKILAEGDSWFAYPRRFIAFGAASNAVQVLAKRKNYVIYSTASNGDEAVTMMTGEQKYGFTKRIGANEFDLLLFSGGGNDIVGKYDFDFFLKTRDFDADYSNCIDLKRLDNKLDQIESVYIELMERVQYYSLNKDIKVVSHTYDYAIPSDEGYELFDFIAIGDSWIYPYLKEKKFDNPVEQRAVIKFMLKRFAERLNRIEDLYPGKLFIAQTQGTLEDKHWRNEIHPTPEGFKRITKIIHDKIQLALQ